MLLTGIGIGAILGLLFTFLNLNEYKYELIFKAEEKKPIILNNKSYFIISSIEYSKIKDEYLLKSVRNKL